MPISYEDKKQRKGEKMKKNRSFLTLLIVVVLTTLLLTGCLKDIIGGKDDDDETAVDISLSSPANGAADQQTSVELKWTGSGTTYDVYLDENSSPKTKIANDVSAKTITHSGLAYSTKYYWKVVATKDGTSEESGVWQFTTKAQQTSTLKDGLVAYYPLTADAKDYSGNNHHGTANGGVSFGSDGATFDGSDDYIVTDGFFTITGNSSRTFSFSINYNSLNSSSWTGILTQDGEPTNQTHNDNSAFMFSYRNNTYEIFAHGHDVQFDYNESNLNQFILLTYSWDGQQLKLYKNGNLVSYKPTTAFNTANAQLFIGKGWSKGDVTYSFDGKLKNLSIYNKALTQAEITQLYNNGGVPDGGANSGSKNIANQAEITYSSISTSPYGGYTPKASDVVDGKKTDPNFWTASSFSGNGWLNFKFESGQIINKIVVYPYKVAESSSLKYKVIGKKNSTWEDISTMKWINSETANVISFAKNYFEHTITLDNKVYDEIRIVVEDSKLPSSYLWRTPITEVEIWSGSKKLSNVALSSLGGKATAISEGVYYGKRYASLAIDGRDSTFWASQWSMPAWLKVEFDKVYDIEKVGVWWGSHKHTFSIELSQDGATWSSVVSSRESKNSEGAKPSHETYSITKTKAKFIRLNITKTSAPSSHIFQALAAELEAYTAK